ncbi:MAG: lasso peptide biosynthesis B2 protein [Polyangiaceae bacterium]
MAGANKRVARVITATARRAAAIAALTGPELAFACAAFALAPVVRASLGRFGLERTMKHLERIVPPRTATGAVSVAKGAELVRWAFRGGDGTCLPESLVQLALHRWFGPEVELVVGVQRGEPRSSQPVGWELRAHAWIERIDPTGEASVGERTPFEPILRRRLRA